MVFSSLLTNLSTSLPPSETYDKSPELSRPSANPRGQTPAIWAFKVLDRS